MKKFKKIAVLAVVIMTFFTLCACGVSVDYYYESNGSQIFYRYDVTVPKAVVENLNSTARYKSVGGASRWTLGEYMDILGKSFGFSVDFGTGQGGASVYGFTRVVSAGDLTSGDSDAVYEVKDGFFTSTVTCTQENPFNGLRAQYDGDETAARGSVMYVLSNGQAGIPAFTEAFPAAGGYSPDELKLNFYWNAGVKAENGSVVTVNGEEWNLWTSAFDNENRKIVYSYKATNPLGYYVVILAAGVAVTAVVLLATSKSAKKPKFVKLENGPVRYTPVRSGGSGINAGPIDPRTFDIYSDDEFHSDETEKGDGELPAAKPAKHVKFSKPSNFQKTAKSAQNGNRVQKHSQGGDSGRKFNKKQTKRHWTPRSKSSEMLEHEDEFDGVEKGDRPDRPGGGFKKQQKPAKFKKKPRYYDRRADKRAKAPAGDAESSNPN